MGTLQGWLQEPVAHKEDELSAEQTVPRIERIAFLVGCNGGQFDVGGWGYIGYCGGPYRSGLYQDEAMELIAIGNFLAGMEHVGVSVKEILWPLLNVCFEARQHAYDKDMATADSGGAK